MLYAAFRSMQAAEEYRKKQGGWIFLPDGEASEPIWFSGAFSPSQIMLHRATRGLSGSVLAGRLS